MNIFKKNRELELQGQIDSLAQDNFGLREEIKENRKTIASFMNVKLAFEEEKNKLTKKHEQEVGQLQKQIETEKKSIARVINEKLASIGISEFLPEELSQERFLSNPEMICKQFTSMAESPEKHEFFKQNEKVISRFIKQQQQ